VLETAGELPVGRYVILERPLGGEVGKGHREGPVCEAAGLKLRQVKGVRN